MESDGPAGKSHPARDKIKVKDGRRSRSNRDPEDYYGRRSRTLNADSVTLTTQGLSNDCLNETVARKVGDSHSSVVSNSKRYTNSPQPFLTKLSNGLKESKSVSRDLCTSPYGTNIGKTSAKASSSTSNQSPERAIQSCWPGTKLSEDMTKSYNEVMQLKHSVHNPTREVDSSQQYKKYSRNEIFAVLDSEQFREAMRKSFAATLKDSLKLHEAGHHREAVDKTNVVTDETENSFEEMLEEISAEFRWPTLKANKNEQTDEPLTAKHIVKQAAMHAVLVGCTGSQDETEGNANKKSLLKRIMAAKVHPHVPSDERSKPKPRTEAELERIANMFCVETEVQALCRRYASGNYTEEEAYRLFPKPGVWECGFDNIEHSPDKVVDDVIDLEIHEGRSYRTTRSRVTQSSAARSRDKSSQMLRRQ